MSQGDALVIAAGATMALILCSRALRGSRLSAKAMALMALAWAAVIVLGAIVAAWWQH